MSPQGVNMIFNTSRSIQSICGLEMSQEELDLLDEKCQEPEVGFLEFFFFNFLNYDLDWGTSRTSSIEISSQEEEEQVKIVIWSDPVGGF